MECPKCHRTISDNSTTCPHCHKVLTLVCPNCRTLGHSAVCENCGYIILEKCSKCGKTISTSSKKCKCGFPTSTSIAYQECESDEFAAITIKFTSLKAIKKSLNSQELFTKFRFKLKNLLTAQLKGFEGCIISYNDTFVINFNKELSFPTSADKAIRLCLKITNAFSHLNLKLVTEFGFPLNLNLTITKKNAEDLLLNKTTNSKVKPLNIQNKKSKYLKGMQVILDQYVQDVISKDYKTDSLYTEEKDGASIIYYELLLDKYVLPPNEDNEEKSSNITPQTLKKQQIAEVKDDIYSFKVFDINAKCNFKKAYTTDALKLLNSNKIICLRSESDLQIKTSDIFKFYDQNNINYLYVNCSEEVTYKPWGLFDKLFKEYFKLSTINGFVPKDFDAGRFSTLKQFIFGNPRKSATPEDARFGYFEDFTNLFNALKNVTIIVDGFEYLDDSSIQALELYFDKYKKIVPNFLFITDSETSLHSKIKGLLRTNLYTEISIQKNTMDILLSELKSEASDFIQSFYYEKISEHCNGSKLYFDNAIKYLIEKDVILNFENKLIIKNNNSVILPADLPKLIRARLKALSKNESASMILAYSALIDQRLDINVFETLGIKEPVNALKTLVDADFVTIKDSFVYINNYNILKPVIIASLKQEVFVYLAKNILAKLGKNVDNTTLALLMGKVSFFKEEYMLLWKNSQFAMAVGDFDAYLKNCLGFLSIIEQIKDSLSESEIEEHKKEVYQNILLSLYSYSPAKIYSIENILLADAISKNDNDNIVKLSNLMLQGALISSNYKDALTLLHNILERIPSPKLVTDGVVNTKFLLLSLVNIEILFNIGEYKECVEIACDLLNIINPENIEKIKPSSFSVGLFINHLMDTFRLAAVAKMISCDNDMDEFFLKIEAALGSELADKGAIVAIKEFLAGKEYGIPNIENATPFSKVIYLILQEFAEHSTDYKTFAQNIYQAKLLAEEIYQPQITLLCDLLIAYSYSNIGITQKAEAIYNDVLEKSASHTMFNIVMLSNYFIAKMKFSNKQNDEALSIINDVLGIMQEHNNQATIIYAILEKLFIDIVKEMNLTNIDIESEELKLNRITEECGLALISGKVPTLQDS